MCQYAAHAIVKSGNKDTIVWIATESSDREYASSEEEGQADDTPPPKSILQEERTKRPLERMTLRVANSMAKFYN